MSAPNDFRFTSSNKEKVALLINRKQGENYHMRPVKTRHTGFSIIVTTAMRARSIRSAIEFVCAHVKNIEWLAYWNVRWDMCSLSLWHGYLPAALDYRCVVGEEGGPINYRGTMAGICVEEERGLPHVLRRSICLMY